MVSPNWQMLLSLNFDEHLCPAQHEEASVMMFEYLLTSNNLHAEFERYGLGERDVLFIKEQIAGPRDGNSQLRDWPYSGRHEEKSFLYEVIAMSVYSVYSVCVVCGVCGVCGVHSVCGVLGVCGVCGVYSVYSV